MNSAKGKRRVYQSPVMEESASADDEFSDESFENIAMRKIPIKMYSDQNSLGSIGNEETAGLPSSARSNMNYVLEL